LAGGGLAGGLAPHSAHGPNRSSAALHTRPLPSPISDGPSTRALASSWGEGMNSLRGRIAGGPAPPATGVGGRRTGASAAILSQFQPRGAWARAAVDLRGRAGHIARAASSGTVQRLDRSQHDATAADVAKEGQALAELQDRSRGLRGLVASLKRGEKLHREQAIECDRVLRGIPPNTSARDVAEEQLGCLGGRRRRQGPLAVDQSSASSVCAAHRPVPGRRPLAGARAGIPGVLVSGDHRGVAHPHPAVERGC
jgi:hypothetical protein